jgi:manganese efflux pump family protein
VQWTELVGIALALSLDAFAVALAAATAGQVGGRRGAFRLSFHFGLFQFLMPVLGWALGSTIQPKIAAVDHWIAFGLLAWVGGHMIWTVVRPGPAETASDPSRGLSLVLLSVATSIDALAVGLSLAMLGITIWTPSVVIGVVTAGMTVLAIVSGRKVGRWLGPRAQVAGGVVLVLIGVRILIDHLG